jgi:hypothetical protein
MPSPIIPKPVLIVRVQCNTAQGHFENISYWTPAVNPANIGVLQAWSDAFDPLIAAVMIPVLCPTATYANTQMQWLDGTHSWQTNSSASAGVGTAGGNGVSDQNAVVVRKETGLAGRSNSGRLFLGGMSTLAFEAAAPDEVSSGMRVAYQTVAAFYGSDQTVAGVALHSRHWNRKTGVLVPIISCHVSSRVASRDDRRDEAYDIPF